MSPLRLAAVLPLLAAIGGAGALAIPALAAPVKVADRDDIPTRLDLGTVELEAVAGGRLQATITTFEAFTADDLAAGSGGAPGSLCLKLWVRNPVKDRAPDYLVCAVARDEDRFRASVVRDRKGRLKKVGTVRVTKPAGNSIGLRFAIDSLGKPKQVTFGAESAQQVGCEAPRGCVDRSRTAALMLPSAAG